MKTAEDLNRLIRDEIATIEALRSEDEKIWSVRGGVTEADAKRSKKIRRMIGDHNNEIAHLRRLIRFVEATPEEGVRMMRPTARAGRSNHRIRQPLQIERAEKRVSDTCRRAAQTHANRRT